MTELRPTLRTRMAGASTLVGAIALAIAPLLGPANGAGDTRQRLTDLAADPAPTISKSLVFQLAVLLFLPGVCAIAARTRGRGTTLVLAGATVYGAGLVGAFCFVAISGMEASLAGTGPVDQSLVDAANRMASSPAAIPTFILALLFFHLIGLPWLTFGMVRARQIPVWLAILATLGTCSAFFGSGTVFETVGWELLAVTFALIALTLVQHRAAGIAAPEPAREAREESERSLRATDLSSPRPSC